MLLCHIGGWLTLSWENFFVKRTLKFYTNDHKVILGRYSFNWPITHSWHILMTSVSSPPPCLFFYFQPFFLRKLNLPPPLSIPHVLSTQLCHQMVCKDRESSAHTSQCGCLSTSSRQRGKGLKVRLQDSIYSCAFFSFYIKTEPWFTILRK